MSFSRAWLEATIYDLFDELFIPKEDHEHLFDRTMRAVATGKVSPTNDRRDMRRQLRRYLSHA